jgi:hypothetical protein
MRWDCPGQMDRLAVAVRGSTASRCTVIIAWSRVSKPHTNVARARATSPSVAGFPCAGRTKVTRSSCEACRLPDAFTPGTTPPRTIGHQKQLNTGVICSPVVLPIPHTALWVSSSRADCRSGDQHALRMLHRRRIATRSPTESLVDAQARTRNALARRPEAHGSILILFARRATAAHSAEPWKCRVWVRTRESSSTRGTFSAKARLSRSQTARRRSYRLKSSIVVGRARGYVMCAHMQHLIEYCGRSAARVDITVFHDWPSRGMSRARAGDDAVAVCTRGGTRRSISA